MGQAPRSPILLAVLVVVCLLPFSNKAFNVDDPLFLWSAQQIAKHPLDPYGVSVLWDASAAPLSEVTKNPPLACYYAAAVGSIAGWSELARFYSSFFGPLPFAFGAVTPERYFLFRIGASLRPDQWRPTAMPQN